MKHPFDEKFLKAKNNLLLQELHFYDRSSLHEASFGLKELRELTLIPGSKVIFDKYSLFKFTHSENIYTLQDPSSMPDILGKAK